MGMSIDLKLPSDLIRNILSFDELNNSKAVSKQWKEYSEMNERQRMKKLYKPTMTNSVDESETVSDESQTKSVQKQTRSTWIVHPKRTHLNSFENELGYKKATNMTDLWETVHACEDGDRILIHDGHYVLRDLYLFESIEFIGLGENVILTFKRYGFGGNDASVSFKKCIFNRYDSRGQRAPRSVCTEWIFAIEECRFEKCSLSIHYGTVGRVVVRNCEFKQTNPIMLYGYDAHNKLSLECTGNSFELVSCNAPTIFKRRSDDVRAIQHFGKQFGADDEEDFEQCLVRDNKSNSKLDSNKVYRER